MTIVGVPITKALKLAQDLFNSRTFVGQELDVGSLCVFMDSSDRARAGNRNDLGRVEI